MRRRIAALGLMIGSMAALAGEDPHLWLEEVAGAKALAWVKERNAESTPLLESKPEFKAIHERLLAIHQSRERIPGAVKRGRWLYNFWQDERHPRGILRRTTLDEYRRKEPAWETVLDVGRLGAEEKENWVYKGSSCLYPDYARCLVSLSRGGADAVVVREFDMVKKAFVEGGFTLPESKGGVAWRDKDTLYVARDFGPGTLSASGYPLVVKEWKRGTQLSAARALYQAGTGDVGVWPNVSNEKGRRYETYVRVIDTRLSETYLRQGERWTRIDVPRDADVEMAAGWLFVRLRTEWKPDGKAFAGGSLVAAPLDRFLAGERSFRAVFEPRERVSLQAFAVTRRYLLLDILDNVKGRIQETRIDGRWKLRDVAVPPAAAVGFSPYDRDLNDDYWLTVTSFLEPTTLHLAHAGSDRREKMKSLPAFFDARGLEVSQLEATSKDGTRVPYFVVKHRDAKLDGANPTILTGYGGFEISETPSYSGTIGTAWLEKGGIYALANIRGGGEFGPEWHLAARRERRQRTHDDFIAVAEDLIHRGIALPRHLGIMGGSQGGLLVGAAFTQRPELFRAVACQVPLLDMKRYHKLLAGASWMGEYGDPDSPDDWAFISKYSPYQNVSKDRKYPRIFFSTSTRDDRVHPGHARKMVARMKEQGHDVLYYENIEGGHAAAVTPAQQAYMWALNFTFFLDELR